MQGGFFGCCFSLSESWVDVVFEGFDMFFYGDVVQELLVTSFTVSSHQGYVKSAFGYFLFVGRLTFLEFSTPVNAYFRIVVRCAGVVASGK